MKKYQKKTNKPRQRTTSSGKSNPFASAADNERMVNDMLTEAVEDSDVEMANGFESDSSEPQPIVTQKPKHVVPKNPPEEKKKSSVEYEGDSSDGSYDKMKPLARDFRDSDSLSDLDEDVQFNGKKFSVSKMNREGTYDFKFLRDKAFLLKSEQEKQEYLERQFKLRADYEKTKERYENQLGIGDFLKPILTGHILRLFQNIKR